MAALAALFVVPSIASAVTLTHPTGTAAKPGLLLEATNIAHSKTIANTVMVIPNLGGNVECARATLTGELTSNSGLSVEGNITTVNFSGTPGEPTSTHCSFPAGFGTVTVTPSHASDIEHEYETGKTSKSLPWCLKAGAEDTFTVRGGKCSEAARPLVFVLHSSALGACTYKRASVTGTYTTHPTDAIATINEQEFTRVTGGQFLCPPKGKLDMAFTITTDGKPNEPVYMDK